MTKAFLILTEDVHDTEGIKAYERASAPTLAPHGAKVLAVDPDVQVLEGQWHGTRTVMLQFASIEAAREWYDSSDYQAAKPLREAAATCNAVLVSGFDSIT